MKESLPATLTRVGALLSVFTVKVTSLLVADDGRQFDVVHAHKDALDVRAVGERIAGPGVETDGNARDRSGFRQAGRFASAKPGHCITGEASAWIRVRVHQNGITGPREVDAKSVGRPVARAVADPQITRKGEGGDDLSRIQIREDDVRILIRFGVG